MLVQRTLIAALCGAALAPALALCQENPAYKAEISIEATLPFVKNTTAYGVPQSASVNGGFLAGYRFFFGRHVGAEVSYGYSRNTQTYGLDSGPLGVGNNSGEVFAAYVFRLPGKRWSPFVLGGAGALVFDPRNAAGADMQLRAGYVYGGGADLNVTRRIFVRAEYRGIFYNSPTFHAGGLNGLDRFTHRAEPSVGFGYQF